MKHAPTIWPTVAALCGIGWGCAWLWTGDYHAAGLNFVCAVWAGLYADALVGEEKG